jgi:hypothetical protein
VKETFSKIYPKFGGGAHSIVLGRGTVLQAERSRFWFTMKSLDF